MGTMLKSRPTAARTRLSIASNSWRIATALAGAKRLSVRMKVKNSGRLPLNPACVLTFTISAWMRSTSDRPSAWIASGVMSVVVVA